MNKYSNLNLQVVFLDVPLPANYGGAQDMFYKLKQLKEAGVQVIAHVFHAPNQLLYTNELKAFCKVLHYYPRQKGPKGLRWGRPYNISSRAHPALLLNLIKYPYPILFEGLHVTGFLKHPSLAKHIKIVRCHNLESHYFDGLALAESHWLKKWYFKREAYQFKKVEANLDNVNAFWPINQKDYHILKNQYPNATILEPIAFGPFDNVSLPIGQGSYILYHGNLGLAENKQAALYILDMVVPQLPYPFVLAGRYPDAELLERARRYQHVRVVANPDEASMAQLMRDAQVHLLLTQQDTGVKLKLLNALYTGRFVVCNPQMVAHTGLDALCVVRQDAQALCQAVENCMTTEWTMDHVNDRSQFLATHYNNAKGIQILLDYLQSLP
jgi:hypothetical protein